MKRTFKNFLLGSFAFLIAASTISISFYFINHLSSTKIANLQNVEKSENTKNIKNITEKNLANILPFNNSINATPQQNGVNFKFCHPTTAPVVANQKGNYIEYENLIPEAPDLKIRQYSYNLKKVIKNKGTKNKFFLTTDEIKKIFARFRESFSFGPEIVALKSIYFNLPFSDKKRPHGSYLSSTNQMYLDASPEILGEKISTKEKIERIFQNLYHEYGHHLFYMYISSPYPGVINNNFEKVVKLGKNQKDRFNYFNERFYKWFRRIFNYEDESTIRTNWLMEADLNSLATEKSLASLFREANDNVANQDLEKNYVFNDPRSSHKHFFPVGNGYSQTTNHRLEYLYSFEELLTRKYQLSTMPFSDTAKDLLNPMLYEKAVNRFTPMFADFNSYSNLKYNFRLFQPLMKKGKWNKVWRQELEKIGPDFQSLLFSTHNFYRDDPFSRVFTPNGNKKLIAQAFVEQVAKYMGHKEGREVSLILAKNRIRKRGTKYMVPKKWSLEEGNNLKIGGYLKDSIVKKFNNQPVFLSTKTKKGFRIHSPINLGGISFGYKKSVFSRKRFLMPSNNNNFYTTTQFIDAQKIANNELYLAWKDQNQKTQYYKLKSFRGQDNSHNEEGLASSWLENYPSTRSKNKKLMLWRAKASDNKKIPGVIIVNNGLYGDNSYT